ncbi:hypothetical protein [uncultured Campylobacter sp.]|nr:hypothetical protein [uncultured Campylobacter sp.]
MKFYRLGPVNLDEILSKFNAQPVKPKLNFKISNPCEVSPRVLKKFQIS